MPQPVPSRVVTLIDLLFPAASTQEDRPDRRFPVEKADRSRLAAILDLIDQLPPELIQLEVEDYSNFVVSVSVIKSRLEIWLTENRRLERIRGLNTNLNPITIIRNALDKCPDQTIQPQTAGLDFIADDDLKENLRQDISYANQALHNGEWKAATILAGATVEALLFYVLTPIQANDPNSIADAVTRCRNNNTLDRNPPGNFQRWTLNSLTEVAFELDLISESTTIQTRLARGFRNLIHPGRALRLGQECNMATAHTAKAALEHVINDLGRE
jgi:hypothetical protein